LPIGATIAGLSNTTIEVWATWDQVQGPWARIFDLGSGQAAYMFLTPRHGRAEGGSPEDSIRFAITNDGFGAEQQVNGPTQFPTGAETHVAVTIDAAADVAKLYVNGKLVATKEGVTLSPADLGNTSNNWLGAGQYFETDPSFDGSISEFRIHDTALSAEEVARSHQLGPDKLVPDAPPGQPTMAAASAGGAIGGCCQPDPCCERSHRRGSGRLFGGRFGRRCR
jgi:hypothetical protein